MKKKIELAIHLKLGTGDVWKIFDFCQVHKTRCSMSHFGQVLIIKPLRNLQDRSLNYYTYFSSLNKSFSICTVYDVYLKREKCYTKTLLKFRVNMNSAHCSLILNQFCSLTKIIYAVNKASTQRNLKIKRGKEI